MKKQKQLKFTFHLAASVVGAHELKCCCSRSQLGENYGNNFMSDRQAGRNECECLSIQQIFLLLFQLLLLFISCNSISLAGTSKG